MVLLSSSASSSPGGLRNTSPPLSMSGSSSSNTMQQQQQQQQRPPSQLSNHSNTTSSCVAGGAGASTGNTTNNTINSSSSHPAPMRRAYSRHLDTFNHVAQMSNANSNSSTNITDLAGFFHPTSNAPAGPIGSPSAFGWLDLGTGPANAAAAPPSSRPSSSSLSSLAQQSADHTWSQPPPPLSRQSSSTSAFFSPPSKQSTTTTTTTTTTNDQATFNLSPSPSKDHQQSEISPSEGDDELIPTAIVIKNIPFAIKKEQLLEIMVDVGLPIPYAFNYHFDNGVFRGLAFANFTTADETASVINALNGHEISGRKLRVEYKKMLPLAERERIEREKREKRGQLEEQHRSSHQAAAASAAAAAGHFSNGQGHPHHSHQQLPQQSQSLQPQLTNSVSAAAISKLDLNDRGTLDIYSQLLLFRDDRTRSELSFSNNVNHNQRRTIHLLAQHMGLVHATRGEGDCRLIVISRPTTANQQQPQQQPQQQRIPQSTPAPLHVLGAGPQQPLSAAQQQYQRASLSMSGMGGAPSAATNLPYNHSHTNLFPVEHQGLYSGAGSNNLSASQRANLRMSKSSADVRYIPGSGNGVGQSTGYPSSFFQPLQPQPQQQVNSLFNNSSSAMQQRAPSGVNQYHHPVYRSSSTLSHSGASTTSLYQHQLNLQHLQNNSNGNGNELSDNFSGLSLEQLEAPTVTNSPPGFNKSGNGQGYSASNAGSALSSPLAMSASSPFIPLHSSNNNFGGATSAGSASAPPTGIHPFSQQQATTSTFGGIGQNYRYSTPFLNGSNKPSDEGKLSENL